MKAFTRSFTLIVLFSLALVTIAGCSASQPQMIEKMVEVEREMVTSDSAISYGEEAKENAAEAPALAGGYLSERMIISSGHLSLLVEDTEVSMKQIKAITEGLGGYVANSNAYHSGSLLRGSMMVRVPARDFTNAFEQFKGLATRVENENTGADDVTEEYSDLSARLRNLEATEEELRELLATVRERTGKAEDILAVHRELTNIRGQIEQLKGRMQYLERMTDLATINIELIPNQIQQPIMESSWNPGLTLKNAFRSLVNAFQFIIEAIIWFVVAILPILLAIAIPIVVLIWLLRRGARQRKARKEAQAVQAAQTMDE
jgi:hypothetical protein